MKFIVSTSTLLKELQLLEGVIGSNAVLPILEDFLFDIKKKKLTLFATDLETSMKTDLEIESSEEGRIAIPAKMLIETLKTLPDQPLTFSINLDKKVVEITSDNGKYKLAGEDSAEFPKMPVPEDLTPAKFSSKVLRKAIESTLFATGTDELRPAMTGVYLQMDRDGATFVATDAHRLVKYTRKDIKSDTSTTLILPKKPLSLLSNAIEDLDVDIEIGFNENNAFFSFENVQLICRLIDAKYPDYNAVIPDQNNKVLTIDRKELLDSLKRVAIYSNKSTYLIRLRIAGSELQIFAEDIDFSNQAQERLTCTYKGEDIEIGFNGKFLIEMLSNINVDELMLELSDSTKAGLLQPVSQEENEELIMIIMPVMLNVPAPEVASMN